MKRAEQLPVMTLAPFGYSVHRPLTLLILNSSPNRMPNFRIQPQYQSASTLPFLELDLESVM